ncbi:hypothetical protein M405DRAFT_822659 [Rhizopogon salebrosus TDB-379]|nr:hypothetical protein M405DRAFT_822659 [Rhizopogon salebrosus TDB-379]
MPIDIAMAASNSSIDLLHLPVPAIPNTIVVPSGPSVHELLASFINLPCEKEDSIETVTKCRSGKILAEESQFALVVRRA